MSRRLTATLCFGVALNPLNSTMIATALSPIGRDFGVGTADIAWLVSVMYLASAIAQPVAGRLADEFGGRRVFVAGCALVAVAGLVGALGMSLALLVVSRMMIGLGTALIYPAAVSMVRERAEPLGMPSPTGPLRALNGATLIALMVGPPLGGVLVDLFGWQAVFAANLPLGAASLAAGLLCLPTTQPVARHNPLWRVIDLPGVLMFGATITIFQILVATLSTFAYLLGPALAGVVLIFVRMELKTEHPFLDFRMLATNPALVRTYLRIILTFILIYGVIFGVTPWLQDGRGLTASAAGLLFLVMSGVAAVTSFMGTWGSRPYWALLIPALALLAGSLAMVVLDSATSILHIGCMMALFGIANGMAQVANQIIVYQVSPPTQVGASAGMSRTAQYLGAMIATGVITVAFSEGGHQPGIEQLALILISVSAILVIVTTVDPSLRRQTDS
ncbi:MFS transporter [Nocardioides sp. S5]|uniref:MFS transporter n=1 Tax=Nocardioides sp. S5 TaxID=2017486 RepID=UPI001AF8013D|nr:MFS transporter [Nocardioides sp. S5]QSR30253.1 MFS transporter [Nocardioides sp. S5]